jgi:outer membrane translocation and assembly module TamA
VLIGLLPNNQQLESNKLLLTGEANINLRNALGNGETIGLNWQQLQVKSPRLNILFQQPFLFASPFGLNASFNLLKKDSSYLNIDMMLGLQYAISTNKTGRVFFQSFRSNLLTVDTSAIKATKQLPQNLDLSIVNLGVDYETSKTNYRLNPRRGREGIISLTAGTRKIRKNNIISDLKQNGFSYDRLYDTVQLSSYQFKVKAQAAQYVAVGQQSAIKFGVNAGFIQSPSLYNNELFQIGGYKLLRGFDEESIYASQYLTTTIEYRYLLALNSYFFGFTDIGFVANKSTYTHSNNNYIGAGVGMSFETKAGLINISFAAGKRNDLKLDLRQTKVHLGFVSYF